MNFKDFVKATQKPELYAPGDAIMWTDDYISRQLLEFHLNPDFDAATRKPNSIKNTIEFILKFCDKPKMDMLDLGCGPGIYAEKLALKEHHITGVDFSENSIEYAKKQATEKKLSIEYICKNYLELNFDESFDIIMLIYADFGVLIPEERDRLLKIILSALKPGGTFIFDVLNDENIEQKFPEEQTWKIENSGFWRSHPYLELINGFHYKDDNVFLKQHTIIDENEKCARYRFWVHYYHVENLSPALTKKGFENIRTFENVLPEGDVWNGENVTFYVMNKPTKKFHLQ